MVRLNCQMISIEYRYIYGKFTGKVAVKISICFANNALQPTTLLIFRKYVTRHDLVRKLQLAYYVFGG